jgi:MOSC domain-containing protein YiiM
VHQINVSDVASQASDFEAKISKEGMEGDRQKNLKVHGGRIVQSVYFPRT